MRAKALAVWGTGSGVGKSLLTAGLLRHFKRLGLRAAPFKAQNMSNHARVVAGEEMASAQWLQALAAGVEPDPRMNPVLVKPMGETRGQVVVLGRVDPFLSGLPWAERRPHLEAPVRQALEGLLAEYDLVVLEGAGSPVERNLWPDLPNLQVAEWAEARALLVADVDQGGSLAALFGTWALLGEYRKRLVGFTFNKFRGDPRLLEPAYPLLESWTGVPVLGALPMLPLELPEEDGFRHRPRAGSGPKVALLRYPHASNLDEFWALSELSRFVHARTPEEAEGADLLILPGSRLPAEDLAWLRGFLPLIRNHLAQGQPVLAVCGGAEMLAQVLEDEEGVEAQGVFPGLGLLPFRVRMEREKTVGRRRVRLGGLEGFWGRLNGLEVEGYEIHHGQGLPLFHQEGPLLATWLHGLLENPGVQRALFGREARGLEGALEELADALERHLDLAPVRRALGLATGGRLLAYPLPQAPTPAPARAGPPPGRGEKRQEPLRPGLSRPPRHPHRHRGGPGRGDGGEDRPPPGRAPSHLGNPGGAPGPFPSPPPGPPPHGGGGLPDPLGFQPPGEGSGPPGGGPALPGGGAEERQAGDRREQRGGHGHRPRQPPGAAVPGSPGAGERPPGAGGGGGVPPGGGQAPPPLGPPGHGPLAQGPSLLHVVDHKIRATPVTKPLPMAHGHRIRGYALPGSGVGVGPLGSFAGYALVGVINDRGRFHRWALLPGNARETWARELLEGLEHVLGDRGGKLGPSGLTRWVEGVVTPPYRTRGGKVVGTPWRAWMGRVRNWIETRLGVMVRSLGLHRMEARSYWGLVARVNLILLAHNLIRSRVLLKMAGVEL